jgi:hypothetical protein
MCLRSSASVTTDHAQCAIRRLDFLGLFHLFKLFLRYCYEPEDVNQDLFAHTYVPKPNEFSDLSEYFVRKVGCGQNTLNFSDDSSESGECNFTNTIREREDSISRKTIFD